MGKDFKKFHMVLCSRSMDSYYDTPVLKHIEPIDFLTQYLSLKPENRRKLGDILTERYQYLDVNSSLLQEQQWLEQIRSLLAKESSERDGRISGYIIKTTVDRYLDQIIEQFKKINQNLINDQ